MTDAEQKLWQRLRREQLGCKFRRQHPFDTYVLDFVCLERKLVIEVDGSQHVENHQYDEIRSAKLSIAGFTVLRFWNNEVLTETDAVVQMIWNVLNPSPPQPSPYAGCP
nr:endonuclease domain-containing protein [Noviherbaspirillum saxi]